MLEDGVIRVRYLIFSVFENILNLNIKASELKPDDHNEEGGEIKVRLIFKLENDQSLEVLIFKC